MLNYINPLEDVVEKKRMHNSKGVENAHYK